MLCGGTVLYDVALFHSDDSNNSRRFGAVDGVFVRVDTLYDMVGTDDLGGNSCAGRCGVLACFEIFRQNRRVYQAKIQAQKRKEKGLNGPFFNVRKI